MNLKKIIFPFVTLILLLHSDVIASAGTESEHRSRLLEIISAQQNGLAEDAIALWNLAELGFMETESAALLQKRLKDAGFKITSGVAGMPTAFIASYSTGDGPVIGILAEYDALPGLSQDATPQRKEMPEKMRGHGCGHNLFGAASVASVIAVKQWMQESGIKGEIRFYGCPAEEGGAGKVFLARGGVFKDVDAVLHWHPFDYNGYYSSTLMAMLTAKISFHGVSSHAATFPERGRSALDGVQLMNMAIEFLREHIPDKSRIHYIISSGGSTPNVVPDYAAVHVTIRHEDVGVVREIWKRIIDASKGAAIATGTTSDYEVVSGMYPILINKTLLEVAKKNFESVNLQPWDSEQKKFVETISKTLPKVATSDPTIIVPPYPAREVNASTDVGDVSWVVPTVGIYAMSWAPGTPAHTWQAVAASGTSLGIKGAHVAAEVMSLTAADLFLDPKLLETAKKEMLAARGQSFKYEPLLGDVKPPLDYQKSFSGK